MMIPQTLSRALTPEPSRPSLPGRGYRRAPSLTWCLIGVLTGALACTGKIDTTDEQPPLSGSATSPGQNGTATSDTTGAGVATGGSARPTPPASAGSNELDNANVRGVDEESNADRRRGGGGRARDSEREDDDESDAGIDELVDAGELDGGEVVVDAGELDAGVVDAAADASTAAP